MASNAKCIKGISLIFVFSLFLYVNGAQDELCANVEVEVIGKTEPVETKYGKVVGQILTNRVIEKTESFESKYGEIIAQMFAQTNSNYVLFKVPPKTSVKRYSSFRGIRYAKPPTGKNRFLVSL